MTRMMNEVAWPWDDAPSCHGKTMRPELGGCTERLLYRCSVYGWCYHVVYDDEMTAGGDTGTVPVSGPGDPDTG